MPRKKQTEISEPIAISNVEKFITVKEMEAVIAVLQARQSYFEDIVREREAFNEKAIAKFEKEAENAPPEILEKLKFLSNAFAKEMDNKIIEDHKKELDVQEGINEFLFRFTGEKQINYKNVLSHNDFLETEL